LIAGFDNIKILKPTGNAQYEGFQILMSGSGCRNYENFLTINQETWFDFLERVCRYNVNFPRLDLAIDDRKTYLSIPELIRLKNEGLISSQLQDISENRSDKLKEEELQENGKSLYMGSKSSDFRIVFYEKGYEQAEKYGKELDTDWNRYELRFRQKKAVKVVQELVHQRDVAGIALSVPFPVSWTVKMKKKQKETQDILSYHTQAAGCSDKARAKASGGRQPIEECGRTGL
jgi:phage replication initiation protein